MMKLPAIVSAFLALIAVILLFFIDFADPNKKETFKLEDLVQSAGDAQTAQLDSLFARDSLPRGHELEILKWIFVENNEYAIQLIQENAQSIERLPDFLGKTAIELIKENDSETTVRLLRVAQRLFPNDPEISTATGIAKYLAGSHEEARQFLEQAMTWRKDNPITNFYLGLILLQSDSVADKARGKHFLKSVAQLEDHDFSEQSAVMLLTLQDIPMLDAEKNELFDLLINRNALRVENKLLNQAIIRRLGNAAASVSPELTLKLAALLMEFPDVTLRDKIVYVHLLNNAKRYGEAAELLNKVLENQDEDIPDSDRIELTRLQAFGNLAAGHYPEAIEGYKALCKHEADEPLLHDLFRQALTLDLPLEVQRELFPLYLELPVLSPELSLIILERLMKVAPLQDTKWVDFAAKTLLPDQPMMVASWLISHKKSEQIVSVLANMPPPLNREQSMALIEGSLAEEDPDTAQLALDKGKDLLLPVHAEFYQARIHLLNNELEEAQERWNASYNAAMSSNAYEMLKNLGFLALDLNQPVSALQSLYSAFTAGIKFNPDQANRLIGLTIKYGNIKQSTNVAEYLYKSYPDEPVYINNLAYFKFLSGEDLDKFIDLMRPLAEDYPDILNYRMTLGLGLLKSGRTNEAMRLMESPPIDFKKTSVQGQVIYAAILIANNQQFVAEGLINSINREDLMPEELALLEIQ